MNRIIKLVKSLEDLGALIYGVNEIVKYEIRKEGGGLSLDLLAPLADSIVQTLIFSVVKCVGVKGVTRAGRGYISKRFLVLLHRLNNIRISNYFHC